jgi:hypothetical protein
MESELLALLFPEGLLRLQTTKESQERFQNTIITEGNIKKLNT